MSEPQLAVLRQMPGASAAIAAAPNMGWPERGFRVLSPTGDCGIVCDGDPADLRDAIFTSFTYTLFHYCPQAKWREWVELSKRILAIDAMLAERDRT